MSETKIVSVSVPDVPKQKHVNGRDEKTDKGFAWVVCFAR